MATISHLPSILIEPTNEDTTMLPTDPPKRHWGRQLWSGFWKLLCLMHLHWNLVSQIPLDLYLSTIFFDRAGPQESMSIKDLLDLHPTLPLLIVSTKSSPDLRFFNTETSEHIWTLRIKMPGDTSHGRAIVKSSITCLKFSKGDHLAVGLSDGTVRLIQKDFATMIKSPPTLEIAQQLNSEVVMLLPLDDSRVNAAFAGKVTNLVFSPSTDDMPGDVVWLAVATEKAGIWIWNQRTSQAIRAVSTAGINEGCLHWVSVVEEQTPKSASRKWSAPPHAYNSQPTGSSIGVFGGPSLEAGKNTHSGESFLVFGTKGGRLQIQRLWNCSTWMVRETSIELSPTAFAQSHRRLTHRFGPASGEITHLVVQSPQITTSAAKMTVFVASENDADSSIPAHQFSVLLPFKEPLERWSGWVPVLAAGIFRTLVNLFLAGTSYRWLSRRKWPYAGDHLLVHSDDRAKPQQSTALTSTSALANTPFLLTTTHAHRSHGIDRAAGDECILRSYNVFIHSLADKATIKPFLPIPDDLPPLSPPPLTPERNYYTAKLARAGIIASPRPNRRLDGGLATHAYECGRVAWGQQKHGEAVGGFLYQPASLLDSSTAVGLFKLNY